MEHMVHQGPRASGVRKGLEEHQAKLVQQANLDWMASLVCLVCLEDWVRMERLVMRALLARSDNLALLVFQVWLVSLARQASRAPQVPLAKMA